MTFAQAFAVLAASWMFGWTPVAAVEIENAAMKIVFAGPEEGFAVRGIVNKKTGGTRYVRYDGDACLASRRTWRLFARVV